MSRKQELMNGLRELILAVEALPEELAAKADITFSYHRAHTLDELRAVVDALPEVKYESCNIPNQDFDCVAGQISRWCTVSLFHSHVIGGGVTIVEPDLTLIQRDRAGAA